MPQSSSRFILSLIIMLTTPLAWGFIGVTISMYQYYSYQHEALNWAATGTITIGLSNILWWLNWKQEVLWSKRKIKHGIIVFLSSILVGLAAAASYFFIVGREYIPSFNFGLSIYAVILTMLTILAWRESKPEAAIRLAQVGTCTLHCPTCQHDITQYPTHPCPNCKNQHTLSKVLNSQI